MNPEVTVEQWLEAIRKEQELFTTLSSEDPWVWCLRSIRANPALRPLCRLFTSREHVDSRHNGCPLCGAPGECAAEVQSLGVAYRTRNYPALVVAMNRMREWLRELGTVEAYFDWRLRQATAAGGTTVVVTVDAVGTRGSYRFRGKPDWARVRKETVGAGYVAALVPNRVIGECLVMCSEAVSIQRGWDTSRGGGIIKLAEKNAFLQDVDRVLESWSPKAGDRVLWDGVRVNEDGQEEQVASAGEYTISRASVKGWRAPYMLQGTISWTTIDHIKPLSKKTAPEKPKQWRENDWCFVSWLDEFSGIGRVVSFQTGDNVVVRLVGNGAQVSVRPSCLRPLTDEDWIVTISGIRVRAYDDGDGVIRLYSASRQTGCYFQFLPEERPLVERLGVPVMPYELSKGNFKRPE